MRGKQSIFFGLSALVAAVCLLGINGYFWWKAQISDADGPQTKRPMGEETAAINQEAPPPPPPEDWREIGLEVSPGGAMDRDSEEIPARGFFPQHVEMAQADAPHPDAAHEKSPPDQPEPPRLLPDAAAALPEPAENDWLKSLVERELPEASEDERQVWSEELQGLGPEMARDILRLRKNMSADSPPIRDVDPEPKPEWSVRPETPSRHGRGLVPTPHNLPGDLQNRIEPSASVARQLESSLAAYEQARNVILHNLTNAHTPGFKRSRIVFASVSGETTPGEFAAQDQPEETPGVAPAVGRGVKLAATTLDVSQGPIKKTGQPLDLAIEGAGFFQVLVQGEVLYTRSGLGAIDEAGRFCLISGGSLCPVNPPMTVPQDALSVKISELGEIQVEKPRSDDDPSHSAKIGQIELVRFTNPAGLKAQGGQLYAATKASGGRVPGQAGSEGFGRLRQGHLELSNVSRDEELEQFQSIQSHWQLLKKLAGTPQVGPANSPVARRPLLRAKRRSGTTLPISLKTLKSLRTLKNHGTNLIEEYLQSERLNSLKRKLGLEVPK